MLITIKPNGHVRFDTSKFTETISSMIAKFSQMGNGHSTSASLWKSRCTSKIPGYTVAAYTSLLDRIFQAHTLPPRLKISYSVCPGTNHITHKM